MLDRPGPDAGLLRMHTHCTRVKALVINKTGRETSSRKGTPKITSRQGGYLLERGSLEHSGSILALSIVGIQATNFGSLLWRTMLRKHLET